MGKAAYDKAKKNCELMSQRLRTPVAYGPVGAQAEREEAADLIDWLNAERDSLIAEVSFHKEWIDSLLQESGPVNKAYELLREDHMYAAGPRMKAMLFAKKLLESAIDGTYEGFPVTASGSQTAKDVCKHCKGTGLGKETIGCEWCGGTGQNCDPDDSRPTEDGQKP